MAKIHTLDLSLSYGNTEIVTKLNLSIPEGKITSIIGPNGCGKSTVLKALARVLPPKSGAVYLDGKAISKQSNIEIAQKLAILPQTPQAPSGLTVEELVAFGRYPHQRGFGTLSAFDKDKINMALNITNMTNFIDRDIDALSGGQRQRVWIAMALAQDTELILLDEPTTYLDLVHQLEVLQLLQKLNIDENRTIVMVIHELNMASRFSDNIIAMKDGNIVAEGTPQQIMTSDMMKAVFSIDAHIVDDPRTGRPVCVTYDI